MANFADPGLRDFLTKSDKESRQEIVANILYKYPDRVPVLVGQGVLKNTPSISKNKYIVPADITFAKFIAEIRKNMVGSLDKKASLFYFLDNNILVPSNAMMSDLYRRYKSDDGFLYITYAAENTFG